MPSSPRYRSFRRFHRLCLGLLLLAVVGAAGTARAQDARLDSALARAGLDARLGQTVPQDLAFRDEAGRSVTLAAFFDAERPVLLTMVYHDCPMLCNLILDGLTTSLKEMDWVPGEQFEVVTVSFSPVETPALAARQKALYLERLGKPAAAAGWHFLTGDEAEIRALARAVGFKYDWVEAQQTYAHPAVLTFLSGEGKITRYLQGLEYPPADVRKTLVEASEGRVGTALDQALLFCFQFDPSVGSYVVHATNVMKAGGVLTVLALGMMLFVFWRRERRRQMAAAVE